MRGRLRTECTRTRPLTLAALTLRSPRASGARPSPRWLAALAALRGEANAPAPSSASDANQSPGFHVRRRSHEPSRAPVRRRRHPRPRGDLCARRDPRHGLLRTGAAQRGRDGAPPRRASGGRLSLPCRGGRRRRGRLRLRGRVPDAPGLSNDGRGLDLRRTVPARTRRRERSAPCVDRVLQGGGLPANGRCHRRQRVYRVAQAPCGARLHQFGTTRSDLSSTRRTRSSSGPRFRISPEAATTA